MQEKYLHIIALNTPYPANYGGVIDIYYKIKSLSECGVKIILHCFEYNRPQAKELEALCRQVYYYPRKMGLRANLSLLPYNVYGRRSKLLLDRLKEDNHPILFEGLHSCYYLREKSLENRIKIVRMCNVEHHYYKSLGCAERHILKKAFYYLEALRFYFYQKNLKAAQLILSVSETERKYLSSLFPHQKVDFVPCFHEHNAVESQEGVSDFILYHGNLSVKENEVAALYIIEHIASQVPYRMIIAGLNPSAKLKNAIANYSNVELIANPSREEMQRLVSSAHIHLLYTFQGTGLKLKLLNSIFSGRHIVANPTMLNGSGLESICHIAHTQEEAVSLCQKLMQVPFGKEERVQREVLLYPIYSNKEQARKILSLIQEIQNS